MSWLEKLLPTKAPASRKPPKQRNATSKFLKACG